MALSAPMAMTAAALWLRDLMLGNVATSVAIVAIAATGLMMLAGRLDWRRGARVVAGCFVLFGAPVIAAGLLGLVDADGGQAVAMPAAPAAAAEPIVTASPPPPDGYDPYAGASLPGR